MLCKDVMRRPVETMRPDQTAQAAAQRMRDANIGFLPVCDDEQGRLAGVISLSDLAAQAPAEAADVLHQVAAREVLGPRVTRPTPR
jgi:CBS domain-containing protein